MDNVQDLPEQDAHASDVLDEVGMSDDGNAEKQSIDGEGKQDDLPKGVKDRLGRQEKRHQRQLRQLRADFEQRLAQQSNPIQDDASDNPYMTGSNQAGNVSEQIQQAVSYALQQKELQERKAKESQQAQHVQKQYGELDNHLNRMGDKYDDFEDVVRNESAPFTAHMRDAALMLPKNGAGSAGEVLYKLGKNPSELQRIANLHPLDQASEMVKLSHALLGGNSAIKTQDEKPIGNIKSNPVTNSSSITEKTPVSDLRQRMKNNWK